MEETRMPLTEHLAELRMRLLKAVAGVAAGFGAAYLMVDQLMEVLTRPLLAAAPDDVRLIGTGVAEAFFTKLKLALIGGIFVGSPVIFYQIWQFVAPGLYEQEKKYVIPFVLFATAFFVFGAWFCYTIVFPIGFDFFLGQFATVGLEPMLRISEYLTFSSRLLVAFGVVFELPVFTFFFARIGLVTHKQMIHWFPYAILVIFIVSAILTPPDAASQTLMAAPLTVLYVLSIGIAWAFAKPRPAPEEPPAS